MNLDGAHVVVTGGSQGIGEAIARAFAAKGARVTVVARQAEKLAAVAKSIGGVAVVADLLNQAQTATLIAEIEATHGPIDVLVNNAGVEVAHPFASMDPQQIAPLVELNVTVPMVLTRHVLPGMLSRGKGHVVFLSSLAGSSVFPGMAVYCGSKAAINNFAGTVRSEVAKTPVGVTIVAPGPVDTMMWDRIELAPPSSQRVVKRFERMQLIPKADPSDIAKRTVEAVVAGRRHVRDPKRLSITFWLNEAPRRLVDLLLTGVKFDPLDRL